MIGAGAGIAASLTVVLTAAARRPSLDRRAALLRRSARGGHATTRPDAAPWVAEAVAALDLALEPTAVATTARLLAVVIIAAAMTLVGPFAALLVGVAAVSVPPVARRVLRHGRFDRREAQLPEALEGLATDLRSGITLGRALVARAQVTPDPLGAELRHVALEIEHGSGVAAALDGWAGRSDHGSQVALVAPALALAADAGGEVARAVDRVAATVRDRQEVQAEVRALATQARTSAGVLIAAPVVFTALVATVAPGALTFLLTSPAGASCLAAGLTLDALGAAWMARILRTVA